MSDAVRHTSTSTAPSVTGVESRQASLALLLGILLAHLGLIWQGWSLPGYFTPLDWWLSGGMLLLLLLLASLKLLERIRNRRLFMWLTLANMAFLAVKLLYSVVGVATSERLLTDLATLLPWMVTVPLLVAFQERLVLRWLGLLFPLVGAGLTLLALAVTGVPEWDARVWFAFLQAGLAGALMLVGAQLVGGLGGKLEYARAENQTLSRLAFFDDLTGLNNRTFLDQRLQELCESNMTLAVLFADLDGFKAVNDTYGHAVGDEVLRLLAARLQEMSHATACLARVSGDEFVVVLAGRTREEIATFAEWMVRELSRSVVLPGLGGHLPEVRLSASVGISLFPEDARRTHDLLLQADRAMYAVKRSGKNGLRFYGDHVLGVEEPRQRIEQELRQARERGELFLMFQPICDLRSGEPHSVEVLLRWNSAALGHVRPDVFIPIAEENGLIGPLGEWVLSSALSAAQVWQAEGFNQLRVAVNVSPAQLMEPGFAQTVRNTLEFYDLPADILELEVTESVDLHEHGQVMATLQELRALGVVLSLDDFGTGFASLSRLNELPVQVVKIDKVFVSDLAVTQSGRSRYVRTLISAMVGVASTLDLALVVEGVETEQQREQLLALGCRRAQGFYFAKPMTEDELRGRLWLQNWSLPAYTISPKS